MDRMVILQGTKGQVTFFIIIGIVLIMVFLFLLVMLSSTKETKQDMAVEQARSLPADMLPVKNFVMSCVEFSASQGLLLMGRQGGRIYDFQGGTAELGDAAIDYLYIPETDAYLAYNVRNYKEGTNIFKVKPPEYPYQGFPIMAKKYFLGGLFGYVDMPLLEDTENPDNNKTMERQLEFYVKNNIKECTKGFENFNNFEIIEGEIITNVTFSESGTDIDVEYPLAIRKRTTDETFSMKDFPVRFSVRIKDMYYFIRSILHEETISMDYRIAGKSSGKIRVKDVNKNIGEGHDDIAIISDSLSTINSEAYEFSLLLENRPPALHYINNREIPNLKKYYKILYDEESILIIKDECGNEVYNFEEDIGNGAQARQYYDPDDDVLNISYLEALPDYIGEKESPPLKHKKFLMINVSDGEYSDSQILEFQIVEWGNESPACSHQGLQKPEIIFYKPWNSFADIEVEERVPNAMLRWNPVESATGYKVLDRGEQIALTEEPEYLHETGYETHAYTIKAYNSTEESPESESATLTLRCTPTEGARVINGFDEDCDLEIDEPRSNDNFVDVMFSSWNPGDSCQSLMESRGYTATCKSSDCGSIKAKGSWSAGCGANTFWDGPLPSVYYQGPAWEGWEEDQMQALEVDSEIPVGKETIENAGCEASNPMMPQSPATVMWDPGTAWLECWKYNGIQIYD